MSVKGRLKHIYGTLRSFDQFGTIVLEGAIERIWEGGKTAEKKRGLLIVRGENLVLLGSVDLQREAAVVSAATTTGARFEDLEAEQRARIDAEERDAHKTGEALGFDDAF